MSAAAVGETPGLRPGPGRLPALLVLGGWALVSVFPLAWMIYGSFLASRVLDGPGLPIGTSPGDFSFQSYRGLFEHATLGLWAWNSALVALASAAGQVLTAAGFAYALAKHRFPGRTGLLAGLGLLMMVPGQVLVVPLFLLVTKLGLVDTLAGAVLPSIVTPFGILLMHTRMQQLPDELVDAARIDGCSEWGVFFRVALPLAAPTAATLGLFAFVSSWNAFLWPLLVLLGSDRYTLAVGLATLQGQHETDHGLLLAGATLSALPTLVLFGLLGRFFTRGLSAGAVKG